MESVSDIDLLEAWHDRRDAQAFEKLTRRYAGLVYSTAKRILKNEAEAEDVTQDTFERLAMAVRPPQASLAPWLHRVATNRAIDRIRTDRNRRERERRFSDHYAETSSHIVWNDIYDYVDEAVDALPEDLRVVVLEYFLRGRSGADIAKDLGITRQAVSHRVRTGVERVRESLRARGIPVASGILATLLSANLAKAADLPASLTATLGRLAVAGVMTDGTGVATTAAVLVGGLIEMKKALIVGAVVAAVAVGIWTMQNRTPPEATPPASPYVARNSDDSEAPRSRTADSETAQAAPSKQAPEPAGLMASKGDIVGRIYDVVTGNGIEGVMPQAFIVAENGAPGERVPLEGGESDAMGNYRLPDLEPGRYEIRVPDLAAYPATRSNASVLVMVQSSMTVREVDFAMEPGAPITGTVVTISGEPVEGASVIGETASYFAVLSRETAVSDSHGAFSFYLSAGDGLVRVQAEKDGRYSPIHGPTALQFEGMRDIKLVLSKAAALSISGSVVDDSMRPVEKASVALVGQELPLGRDERDVRVLTEADGSFRFASLIEGDYDLYLGAPGNIVKFYGDAFVMTVHVGPGRSVNGLRLFLGSNLFIAGRVIDETGTGVPGVTVKTGTSKSESATTGPEGRFLISGLDPGNYPLEYTLPGSNIIERAVRATAGETDVEIRIERAVAAGRLEGRVVDAATREPVTAFSVMAVPGGFSMLSEMFYLEHDERHILHPNGEFIIDAPLGDLNVVVSATGYVTANEIISFDGADSATPIQVALKRSRKVTGRIVDERGKGIANARVFWGLNPPNGDRSRILAYSDANGIFEVNSIPANEDTITAVHPAYAAASAKASANVTLVLQTGGSLEGRLMTAGGPVTKAFFDVHSLSSETRAVVDLLTPVGGTDNGYYRIDRVPPGAAKLTVVIPNGPSVERETRVESGRVTREDFQLELGAATVHGHILGIGEGVGFCQINLSVEGPNGPEHYQCQSRADRSYIMEGVSSGAARLVAEAYGGESGRLRTTIEFTIDPDAEVEQDIEFGPLCTVSGIVRGIRSGHTASVIALDGEIDLSGLATVDDIEAFLPTARGMTMDDSEVDSAGAYQLSRLPAGVYTLVALEMSANDPDNVSMWRWVTEGVTLETAGDVENLDLSF